MNLTIKNGRVIDPSRQIDRQGNLYIGDGRIVGLFRAPAGFKAERVIQADGLLVVPGLVDLSVRLREPGSEHKATLKSELAAAAHAGVTTLCCPPDTDPVIDRPAVVESIMQRCKRLNKATVHCIGALTSGLAGENLAEMFALKVAGCVALSNAYASTDNSRILRHCLEYARSCDIPVFLFAEDAELRNNGVLHEGVVSTRLGLPAVPETAETVAFSRALLLAEQTGARLHFCRLSTARAVDMLARAQRQGLPVTADVDICHLLLTELDASDFNSACHLRPPLRTQRDQDALLRGLAKGVIAAVCSDHQPHDADAKARPFSLTEPGASTIELLLPLLMHAVQRNKLDLVTAIAALTHRPAAVAGIDAGTLAPGRVADICLLDPDRAWEVTPQTLLSRGKNTPFSGWTLSAQVVRTLHRGRTVYEL